MLRWGLAALGACVAAATTAGCSAPSVAKYQYCLMTNDGERDCRYASLEQCEVSRAGVGGSCDPSPYYTGGSAPRGPQAAQGVPPPPVGGVPPPRSAR
jgi:uncharacterized protein DUF3551